MNTQNKTVKLHYLVVHHESDCLLIVPTEEIYSTIISDCEIISQGYDLDKLITQGFGEASKRGYSFAGYKEPDKIKNPLQAEKKQVVCKPGTKSPINLKHRKA